MDDGDHGAAQSGAQTLVEPETGGVDQFVLEEDIEVSLSEPAAEAGVQVVQEADPIAAPGETDDLHSVAGLPKIADQVPVIDEAAGDGVQAAVNEQAYMHYRSSR
jgi:hypothetical protein